MDARLEAGTQAEAGAQAEAGPQAEAGAQAEASAPAETTVRTEAEHADRRNGQLAGTRAVAECIRHGPLSKRSSFAAIFRLLEVVC